MQFRSKTRRGELGLCASRANELPSGERRLPACWFRLAAETSRLAACAPQREVRLRGTRKVRARHGESSTGIALQARRARHPKWETHFYFIRSNVPRNRRLGG